MDVITIETEAYQDLISKINTIAKFVVEQQRSQTDEEPVDSWVDSYEVCTFLKISERTLQRLRSSRSVNFSVIRGKTYYRVSEIKRLLENNVIRRSDEHFQELIKNHQLHVQQRRDIRKNK